jgi:hypothetical protein
MPALAALPSRRDAPKARLGAGGVALLDPTLKRSALSEILAPFPLPALWALAALTADPTLRERLLDYLTKARSERPLLTAEDLLALGIPQGPQLGEALRRLRDARLDGAVTSRDDEEHLVRRLRKDVSARRLVSAHPEVSKE